ncbi:hypothetical protein KW834_22935 [Pseudomonas sp. PDM29]|uniref:hypothetical protein n=1 Tax=Pseudomonas sp. PDM29 TaxID=2854771 RepID=UPI001C448CE0|nr:hypothetical protein [Pseudomonas sp. PDM29]MBV7527269.1 hypothetical protein [Pseudomonas sp. PDM29]
MSIVDDLKGQISKNRIIFDKPELKDQLLGEDVTAELQALVHHLSILEKLRISSIIRAEGHHGVGRAFDIGNEEIAKTLLPKVATDPEVMQWKIDEIIFDASKSDSGYDRNKWNYDIGVKHKFDEATLNAHSDHIHFAVKAPAKPKKERALVRALRPQGHASPAVAAASPANAGGLMLLDFRTYPDNHVMPADFTLAGVGFESIGGVGRLMVNDTANDRGLQFDASGLRVVLRRPVNGLLLYAGGFAGAITVTALDSSGAVIHQQVVKPANVLLRILLNAPNMRTLEFTGGGGEGMLVEMVTPD